MGAASQELTERAKLLISERKYQEAVRACRRALLSKPDQVEIRLLLGEALLALERYDEVRVEMMALARKVPDRADVYRVLGEAYLRDGRPNQATEALRKALELDPSDEVAQELIGEAADENAPISTTIERWFADEAEPTVETESPTWEEEHTGPVPSAKPATPAEPSEPSVQIDPSLASPSPPRAAPPKKPIAPRPGGTAAQGSSSTNPARPAPRRMRSRKPTLAGHAAAFGYDLDGPKDAAIPPPPGGGDAVFPP
ncbi:MAG TPA: tetratricopeptide repeat protein, partial [Sandaracinaceae bacterium LLY-WYZ-13_1]|nr:tetratricopeptide repeat protein [Sandaracinaceae bacterium LLY-WYZ-13_1]